MKIQKDKIINVIGLFIIIALFCLCLSGCAKVVNTESTNVLATITDMKYRSSYITPIRSGKTTTYVTHPAIYIVVIQYKDIILEKESYELYEKYKGRIGENIECKLITKYYDNNTTRSYLSLNEY